MGWPVVTVASGGIAVTDNSTLGYGIPVEEAASNGRGTAVTYVASGGIAVVGGDPTIPLKNSITSFWTLNEASGTRADSVGGQTLSATGTPTAATAINGNGVVTSSGNYLTAASSAALQTGDIDFTVACRMMLTSGPLPAQVIAKGSAAVLSTIEYGIAVNASGFIEFDLWQAGSVQVLAATTIGNIQVNKWYDVICWVDVAANTINIEVNGVLDSATKTKTPVAGNAAFAVGAYANGANPFVGVVDDLTSSKTKWTLAMRQAWRRKTYPFNTGQGIFDTGQLYTVWAGSVNGTTADILIPTKVGFSGTMVLYTHGSGEIASVWETDSLKAGIRDILLTDGHILCASLAHGNTWGNDQSNTDYVALYTNIIGRFTITRTLGLFQSMGGTSGFKIVADNLIANIKGVYCIYPVCNLANLHGNATFTAAIDSAYGGNYAVNSVGHDPVLFTSGQLQKFTMRMRFTSSYADTVVPRIQNTDTFQPLISPYAAESVIVTTTGDHGDASNFVASDVKAFFDRCT